MFIRLGCALLAATLLITAGYAKDKPKKKGPDDIGNGDPGKGVNFYSLEKEMALGHQMALEVERESRPVYDSSITEYVNRLGQNLVRNSDAKVPFVIKVLDSDEVNAFALPGGFMFVNTDVYKRQLEALLHLRITRGNSGGLQRPQRVPSLKFDLGLGRLEAH